MIDQPHLVYLPATTVTEAELDALEAELGAELPRGYRAFMSRYGHGWINDWFQLYCPDPQQVREERDDFAADYERNLRDYPSSMTFTGARLGVDEIAECIQIGVNQDMLRLLALPRHPGCVFAWDNLTVTEHTSGVEDLEPFAAMRMDRFCYMMPFDPEPAHRSFACQSKRVGVDSIVELVRSRVEGEIPIVDVDEGPNPGSRSPAFWLFPEKLGAKLHVYGVVDSNPRRVYLTVATSVDRLDRVVEFIEEMSKDLPAKIRPSRWH